MHRALPTNNKVCHKRWVEKCQALHRKRLKFVKSTVKTNAKPFFDNSRPETAKMPHLVHRMKKMQKEGERYAEIERENTILLSKISSIMQQNTLNGQASEYMPGIRLNSNQYPVIDNVNQGEIKSLNKEYRKRELMRITAENQSILKRIQHKEPYYDHLKWREQRGQNETYLKNICEYPFTPRSQRGTPRYSQSSQGSRRDLGDLDSARSRTSRGTARSGLDSQRSQRGSSRRGPRPKTSGEQPGYDHYSNLDAQTLVETVEKELRAMDERGKLPKPPAERANPGSRPESRHSSHRSNRNDAEDGGLEASEHSAPGSKPRSPDQEDPTESGRATTEAGEAESSAPPSDRQSSRPASRGGGSRAASEHGSAAAQEESAKIGGASNKNEDSDNDSLLSA